MDFKNNNNNIGQNNSKSLTLSPFNGKIGLNNLGNTCYINSILQNLKNIFLLTKLILINENINVKNDGLSFQYKILLANLINQDIYRGSYNPNIFYKILNKKEPFFAFNKQNDSSSFLITFLNYLVNEIKNRTLNNSVENIKFKPNSEDKDELIRLNNFQNNFFLSNNSPIIDIFYGCLESIFKCTRCSYIKYNFQSFNVLNLPMIYEKKKINCLEEAIKFYQEERKHIKEINIYCPKCQNCVIINQRKIIALPKILIINLIRVGNKTFHRFDLKIPPKLEMKDLIENKNYNENKYELIGFVKHYGGPNSGHNISICKNFFDEKWYLYNDSVVIPITSKIDTSNSFLYFYKLLDNEEIKKEDLFIIETKAKKIRSIYNK